MDLFVKYHFKPHIYITLHCYILYGHVCKNLKTADQKLMQLGRDMCDAEPRSE